MRNGYDGHIHERIAGTVARAFTLASAPVMFFDPWLGIGLLVGGWVGWFISPDIDHRSKTMEEYRAERLLGCIGSLWIAMWKPYARMFGHRSPWTHGGPGTLIRALCLFWPVVVLQVRFQFWQAWPFWIGLLAAWEVQDLLHYWKDGI